MIPKRSVLAKLLESIYGNNPIVTFNRGLNIDFPEEFKLNVAYESDVDDLNLDEFLKKLSELDILIDNREKLGRNFFLISNMPAFGSIYTLGEQLILSAETHSYCF